MLATESKNKMLIVKDEKKIKIIFGLAYFALALFLFDFLLSNTKTNGVWEWLFASVIFFFVGPLVLIKYVFKGGFKKHFLSFSFNKKSLLLSFTALLLYIFTILIFVI